MALPRRLLLRAAFQTIFGILCFNIGYMTSFFNQSTDLCLHPNTVVDQTWSQSLKTLRHHKALLLIAIVSRPNNAERRTAIRETWLNLPRSLRQEVLPVFVLGQRNLSPKEEEIVDREITEHRDILALDIEDSFVTLTKKVLSLIQFASHNLKFDYMLKVDDDSFVRVDAVLDELRDSNYQEKLYWGFFDGRAPVITDENNKWREEKGYILCDRYLPYALGGGYVLSKDLVDYIAQNGKNFELYGNEDVSVGTWLGPLKINRIHDVRFDTEFRSRGCSNQYLVTHKQSVQEMRAKQYSLISKKVLCDKEVQRRKSYNYNWAVSPSKCCSRVDPNLP